MFWRTSITFVSDLHTWQNPFELKKINVFSVPSFQEEAGDYKCYILKLVCKNNNIFVSVR